MPQPAPNKPITTNNAICACQHQINLTLISVFMHLPKHSLCLYDRCNHANLTKFTNTRVCCTRNPRIFVGVSREIRLITETCLGCQCYGSMGRYAIHILFPVKRDGKSQHPGEACRIDGVACVAESTKCLAPFVCVYIIPWIIIVSVLESKIKLCIPKSVLLMER